MRLADAHQPTFRVHERAPGVAEILSNISLTVGSANLVFNATQPFSAVTMNGGSLTFNAPQTLTTLVLNGGSLSGSGDVTITDSMTWSGGTRKVTSTSSAARTT